MPPGLVSGTLVVLRPVFVLEDLDPVAVALDDKPKVWEKHPHNVVQIYEYKKSSLPTGDA